MPSTIHDKNAKIGGKLNVLKERGYSFDLGPSILTLPHIFGRLFERSGKKMADYFSIRPLRPHWRNFFEDGKVRRPVSRAGPHGRGGAQGRRSRPKTCERFLKYSADLYDLVNAGYFEQGLDTWQGFRPASTGCGSSPKFDLFRTMHGGVKSVSQDASHAGHVRLLHQICRLLGVSLAGVHELPADDPVPLRPLVRGRRPLQHCPRPAAASWTNSASPSTSTARSPKSAGKVDRVTGLVANGTFHPADIIVSNMEVIPPTRNCCGRTRRSSRTRKEARALLLRPRAGSWPRLPIPAARAPQLLLLRPSARALPHRLPQTPVAARPDDLSRRRVQDRSNRRAARLRLPEDSAAHSAHRGCAPADPRGLPGVQGARVDKLERMGLKDLRKHVVFEHCLDAARHPPAVLLQQRLDLRRGERPLQEPRLQSAEAKHPVSEPLLRRRLGEPRRRHAHGRSLRPERRQESRCVGPMLILLARRTGTVVGGLPSAGSPPPLRSRQAHRASPASVSVIIPARNEEQNLPTLLRSLAAQPVKPREILVVDDGSTDRTAEVARRLGATVIVSQPLPDGWRGKTWACHQGAQAATGELLLFVDADTWFEPDGLRRSCGISSGGASFRRAVPRGPESLRAVLRCSSIVMAAGTVRSPFWATASRRAGCLASCCWWIARATGASADTKPSRAGSWRTSGWPSSFARRASRCEVARGRGVFSFRMYPHGLRELMEAGPRASPPGRGRRRCRSCCSSSHG